MRFGVLVNSVATMATAQTTLELASRILDLGHELLIFDVASLGFDEQLGWTALALDVRIPLDPDRLAVACCAERSEWLPLAECDAILVRTSPGRDPRATLHQTVMGVLAMLEDDGIPVLSSPAGLQRAATKAYLARASPEHRPRMRISATAGPLRAFIASERIGVLKPVTGTRGSDVFLIDERQRRDPNGSALADAVCRERYAMAQEYLPEAPKGDVRVLVLEGKILSVGVAQACVRRLPGAGEFRSNVHCGGHASPTTATPGMREVVDVLGPRLQRDGIFLAGIDFVGDRVVEINVFAPGGIGDACRYYGVDFYSAVVAAVERRAASARRRGAGSTEGLA